MKKFILNGLLATAFLSPFAMADDADAREREYCREYTKTIRVNGRKESGYGTACRQPDGSWMIVSARGDVDPFGELLKRDVVLVAQNRPVYFRYGPRFRPVTYFVPAGFYYGHGYGFYDRDWPPGWRNHKHRQNHHAWNHFDDEDEHGYRRHKKH